MARRFASWRSRRGWPTAGQIGLAIIVGLVVAAFIGALSRHDGSKAAVSPTVTSGSTESTTTAVRASTTTRRPVTHPPTTRPPAVSAPTTVTRATTVPPFADPLLPLTIASASHAESYSRDIDFGGWIDVDGCRDTRAAVLMRTSLAPVTFTTARQCTVKTGRWTDPWSGEVTTVAHDFQIDHTVPLANAWRSGAWAWSREQRVAYANDLADKDHLVPIPAAENEAKGDSGPDQWRPPVRAAWCRYAVDWDHIKARWHLTATPGEWTAIEQMVQTC